jgi:hypothetical protein
VEFFQLNFICKWKFINLNALMMLCFLSCFYLFFVRFLLFLESKSRVNTLKLFVCTNDTYIFMLYLHCYNLALNLSISIEFFFYFVTGTFFHTKSTYTATRTHDWFFSFFLFFLKSIKIHCLLLCSNNTLFHLSYFFFKQFRSMGWFCLFFEEKKFSLCIIWQRNMFI